jgi:ATP-dependent DNA helicase RecQ
MNPMDLPAPNLAAAQRALRSTFGFADFRPGQSAIIESVLNGADVLAIMPTGSGKSLCYQLPALLRDGLTVVVSPLIALMRNQILRRICIENIHLFNIASTY